MLLPYLCCAGGRRGKKKGEEHGSGAMRRVRIVAELECGDPDDMITLAWLAGNPRVDLVGVCMVPGTTMQVSIAAQVLRKVYGDGDKKQMPPIASCNPNHTSKKSGKKVDCVSGWHTKPLERQGAGLNPTHRDPDMTPYELYMQTSPDVVITGAPPKGLAQAMQEHFERKSSGSGTKSLHIPLWVCQGGFAGDSVVPAEHRLAKFEGKEVCPTYNLGGGLGEAKLLFSEDTKTLIPRIRLVSKNVCHGVVYDRKFHEYLKENINGSSSLKFIWDAMDAYLRKRKSGKKLHDPLAAAVCLDSTVCEYAQAVPYQVKGSWGSRLDNSQKRFDIAISVNMDKFRKVFAYRS
mmetsp:Transcript_14350/g.34992  ORF Transcript_14350/g.34992 Transcript_14350/m.34992 type:complete len:348 (+) Transcript_14350:125-1168(+)